MTSPSVALVPYHLAEIPRAERRRRDRRERRLRLFIRGLTGTAAAFLVGTVLVNVWPDEDDSGAAEVAQEAPAATVLPPPPPPVLAAESTTTTSPYQAWPVQLPGWQGDGWLVTDGAHGPKIIPGEIGQAVVSVPTDPTPAATFNLGERQWRVIERRTFDATSLAAALRANPIVPTVLLVSSLPTPIRPGVVAR